MDFIKGLVKSFDFKCNADARTEIAKCVIEQNGELPLPHNLLIKEWVNVIRYAIEVGGCQHGTKFTAPKTRLNAEGEVEVFGKITAEVVDLYRIPNLRGNCVLSVFSGYMPAGIYALEAVRAYKAHYGKDLPIFATGKGGNKGLYADVFNRSQGIMVDTEAEAYMRIMERVLPSYDVRHFQRSVADIDTKGNFSEMYQLAKAQGWQEATFILCAGQPWYTKRLIAEGLLELGKPEYADVKMNLIVLDCPITLDSSTPEGHLSEIMLGYIAASLGPLSKDTTPLVKNTVPDFSKERYDLLADENVDWSKFEKLITGYSNMGWPNYQELLYGVDHETAVYNVILSDLRARASFTPEQYDEAIKWDIDCYKRFVASGTNEKYFKRVIYLKCDWKDGAHLRRSYDQVSYLSFQTDIYEDWDIYLGDKNLY